jgi:hypothetical protein
MPVRLDSSHVSDIHFALFPEVSSSSVPLQHNRSGSSPRSNKAEGEAEPKLIADIGVGRSDSRTDERLAMSERRRAAAAGNADMTEIDGNQH